MVSKIKLKKDFILLTERPPKEGAFFTEGVKEYVGTIAHIGPNVSNSQIGDLVYFEEYDHSEVIIEGITFIKCREEAIICKIEA
jgi:co-chaperonin GroES (HSP10)